jgi:hypothetical protein
MNKMKSFLRHLKKNPLYVDGFDRKSVFANFQREDDPDIQILYANYHLGDYEGSALVIYYRKSTRQYYEAYGAHCSCYGLEGQWEGDEILVPEEIENRLAKGNLYDGDIFKQAFERFIEGG